MKAVLPLLAVLGLAACSSLPAVSTSALPGSTGGTRGASDLLGAAPLKPKKLLVSLFDAPLPGNLAINIAIDGVQLLNGNTVTDWESFSSPDVVDLLQLQSSSHDFNDYAPDGKYTGLRMLVDPVASNVTINGMNIPLVWGVSSTTSANTRIGGGTTAAIPIDFKVNFTVGGTAAGASNNGNTHLALDFNVLQSVKFQNGAIYITPSTSAAENPGDVKGSVLNLAGKGVGNATVTLANLNGVVVNVTSTAGNGKFDLHAVPPGTYNITVQNTYMSKSGNAVSASGFDAGVTPPSTTVTVGPEQKLQLDPLTD